MATPNNINKYSIILFYHFLHDQYLAVNLLGGLVSHLCLARKDFRLAGISFLMVMLGSPNLINLTLSPTLASTANFLDLPGVRLGLYKLQIFRLYTLLPCYVGLTFRSLNNCISFAFFILLKSTSG